MGGPRHGFTVTHWSIGVRLKKGEGGVIVFRRGDVDVMLVKSTFLGLLYSDVFDKRMSIRVEAGLRSITK